MHELKVGSNPITVEQYERLKCELKSFSNNQIFSTLDKKTKREIRDETIPRLRAQDFADDLESVSERVNEQSAHPENKSRWPKRFDITEVQDLNTHLAKERIKDSTWLNKVVGCCLCYAGNALTDETGKKLKTLETDLKDAIRLQFAHLEDAEISQVLGIA